MLRKYLAYGSLGLGVAVLIHCGSSDSPLFDSGDSGSGEETGVDGGTVGLDANSLAETRPADPFDSGPDGTVISSGGTTNDAGPGGTTISIPCGATTCAIPSQACCVDRIGGGLASFACVSGTGCPVIVDGGNGGDPPTALQCSGAANCTAGTVCCVEQVGKTTISACKATCAGGNTAQLCDPKASVSGCPVDAGQASTCSNNNIGDWGLPKSFATCGGKGN